MNSAPKQTGLEVGVIGMAGRFPGAPDLHRFWDNLKNGVESIGFYSDEELLEAGIDRDLLENPHYVRSGGGALEDKEYFDASFFGYSAMEAELMDPQVRIFHECAWHALEDAGYDPFSFDGLIGLYAGASFNLYWEALSWFSGKKDILGDFATWLLIDRDNLCTRVSYNFNLKGPSLVVKSACSTSLAAVHMACQAIINGECDMALAGGVTITKLTKSGYFYHEDMIFSPDGHCRVFDAQAKGTVGGDGIGIVVLKRLQEAAADGDHIYAVIKSTAINNDGVRKAGYTAPSIIGQSEVIDDALQVAEVEPESITYMETHGTGTVVGDPIEIEGLKLTFKTNKKRFCRIGSVKSNIGHLDSAAGIAGFIKTVLALKHGLIPPSLHFENPNSKIDFENSPFYVNSKLSEWKRDGYPLRAGVSSFGIGGTNTHIILEEAPEKTPLSIEETPGQGRGGVSPASQSRKYQLILLSAKTQNSLDKMSINLAEFLKNNPGLNLADAAYTLKVGRKAFPYRRLVVGSDMDDTIATLTNTASRKIRTFYAKEEKKSVIFMFPGLGAQYVNMGLGLYQSEPIFREEMNRCFEILKPLLGYDIKEILYPGEAARPPGKKENPGEEIEIHHFEIAQVVMFILEYALARLLMNGGIEPHGMIGYSFGEYTAACLSGVFSLADVLKLIVVRGQLIARVNSGSMLSVPLAAHRLKPLLPPDLWLAIDNGSSCIAAGPDDKIEAFANQLKEQRYMCMKLPHSHGLHSAMMGPILEEFKKYLGQVKLNRPQIPYISNLTGTWITVGEAADPGYWSRHLGETVQFAAGIDTLKKESRPIFVEIGPGRDLRALLVRYQEEESTLKAINLLPPQQHDAADDAYLLSKIGQLWLYGVAIDWQKFYRGEKRLRIPLPHYTFERRRFWFEGNPLRDGLAVLMKKSPPAGDRRSAPDRAENPEPAEYLYRGPESDTAYAPPTNKTEEILVHIWEEFFGTMGIGIKDDFFDLGGDSLKAAIVISRIHKELDVLIPLEEFFKRPSLEALALFIAGNAEKSLYSAIEPVEKKEYYPLSPAQRRLYVLWQLDSQETANNIPSVSLVEGQFDKSGFENTFKHLLKRHDSLRTSFAMMEEEPVQWIHDDVEFELEYFEDYQSAPLDLDDITKGFIRPFDLANAPLLRARVLLTKEKHLLLVDMHHIISDGISNTILLKEFTAIYNQQRLPRLRLQYKDFSQWQAKWSGGEKIKSQEEYWLKQFEGNIPVLDMPSDYPRPERMSFKGDSIHFTFGKALNDKLRVLRKETGTTLYMVLLAAFNILLSKHTGQEDIVVGSPIIGRSHPDLQNIIGMFVNMLAMRNFPRKDKTFENFLEEVKQNAFKAYQNQDFQFEELVKRLGLQGNFSRNPLFDAVFQLINLGPDQREISDLKILPFEVKVHRSQFDLDLNANESADEIRIYLAFATALFKRETAEKLMKRYVEILEQVVNNKKLKLGDIKISHDRLAIKVDISPDEVSNFGF